jgi:hypothetical protein
MLKKSLFVVAALALLAGAAQAGENKFHGWEKVITKEWVKQEACTFDVIMDIGYWVHCVDQNDLEITQNNDFHKYRGCKALPIECNFDLILSATVASTGNIAGDLSVEVGPVGGPYGGTVPVNRPGGTVDVCVDMENVDLLGDEGGTQDVHVATVTIWVIPAAAP